MEDAAQRLEEPYRLGRCHEIGRRPCAPEPLAIDGPSPAAVDIGRLHGGHRWTVPVRVAAGPGPNVWGIRCGGQRSAAQGRAVGPPWAGGGDRGQGDPAPMAGTLVPSPSACSGPTALVTGSGGPVEWRRGDSTTRDGRGGRAPGARAHARRGGGASGGRGPERAAGSAAGARVAAAGGGDVPFLCPVVLGGRRLGVRRGHAAARRRRVRGGGPQRRVRVRAGGTGRARRRTAPRPAPPARDRGARRRFHPDTGHRGGHRRHGPVGGGRPGIGGPAPRRVHSLALDTSTLTGESVPAHPAAGETAYAGCFVVEGKPPPRWRPPGQRPAWRASPA
jgi:hypothetical protein